MCIWQRPHADTSHAHITLYIYLYYSALIRAHFNWNRRSTALQFIQIELECNSQFVGLIFCEKRNKNMILFLFLVFSNKYYSRISVCNNWWNEWKKLNWKMFRNVIVFGMFCPIIMAFMKRNMPFPLLFSDETLPVCMW